MSGMQKEVRQQILANNLIVGFRVFSDLSAAKDWIINKKYCQTMYWPAYPDCSNKVQLSNGQNFCDI
jgi:hypothetical protein